MNDVADPAPADNLTPAPPGGALTYIGQAWLVLLLAVLFGAGLAGVERWLGPMIVQNQRDEAREQVPALVPHAERGEFVRDADGNLARIEGHRVLRALAGDELVGWVVIGEGQGFADTIKLLVGVDREARRITGMYVVDQKETPGLGDAIRDPQFRAQFVDGHHGAMITSAELAVVKDDAPDENQIQAISGATISSQAVCDIINQTLGPELCTALRERAASSGGIAPGDADQGADGVDEEHGDGE